MNVNVFCSIKSSIKNSKVNLIENNNIANILNGPSLKFNHIFRESDDAKSIYNICLKPLVNCSINGFNSCFLIFGETRKGNSHFLTNNKKNRSEIFSLTVQDIFHILETDERFKSTFKVRLRMFNVFDNSITDLIKSGSTTKFSAESIAYSINESKEIKELTTIELTSTAQAIDIFSGAWNRRIAQNKVDINFHGSVFIQISLLLKNIEEEFRDTISQMTFVLFPGEESIVACQSDINKMKDLNGLLSIQQILEKQADPTVYYIDYGESVFTKLLEDTIGGNCVTSSILCLTLDPNPSALECQMKIMYKLSKIQNYPITNTNLARILLFNIRVKRSRYSHGVDFKDFKRLQSENVLLRDKVEELQFKLSGILNKYEDVNVEKFNFNDFFLLREEEKLASSKKILDLEILNKKLKEEIDTIRFELKSKILQLEGKLTNFEIERELYEINSKELNKVKEEKTELLEKCTSLKKGLDTLKNKSSVLNARNQELSLEFINMVNKTNVEPDLKRSGLQNFTAFQTNIKDKESYGFPQEMKVLSPINSSSGSNLKLRLGQLQEELQKCRNISQERLKESSKNSMEVIILREENKKMKTRQEYFNKYINSVTQDYKDQLRKYANNILELLHNNSYSIKFKEEDLAAIFNKYDSSQKYKENMQNEMIENFKNQIVMLNTWCERAIIEYIMLRETIVENNIAGLNIGLDLHELLLTYPSPSDNMKLITNYLNKRFMESKSSNITELKQQIKEFGNTTIIDLEIERAQLIARNIELEEELLAAQNYIDLYLKKKH